MAALQQLLETNGFGCEDLGASEKAKSGLWSDVECLFQDSSTSHPICKASRMQVRLMADKHKHKSLRFCTPMYTCIYIYTYIIIQSYIMIHNYNLYTYMYIYIYLYIQYIFHLTIIFLCLQTSN